MTEPLTLSAVLENIKRSFDREPSVGPVILSAAAYEAAIQAGYSMRGFVRSEPTPAVRAPTRRGRGV